MAFVAGQTKWAVVMHNADTPTVPWAVTGGCVISGGSTMTDLATELQDNWVGAAGPFTIQSGDVVYDRSEVHDLTGVLAPVYLPWAAAHSAGSIGAHPAPPNCAMVHTLYTAHGGRRGRGRWFVPGIQAGSMTLDNTRWDLTVGNNATAMNTFLGGVNAALAGTLDLAVVSQADKTLYPITALQVRSYFGTQRRRLT